jgi:hypothetical protein
MPMSAARADENLNDAYTGAATPFLQLHIGDPGVNGTANIAQTDAPANIDRKAVSFGAVGNHATNIERRVLNDAEVSWSGAEIAAAQEITHASIWSASTAGQVEDIVALATPKTTGSDGVTVAVGDLEVAYTVYAKP